MRSPRLFPCVALALLTFSGGVAAPTVASSVTPSSSDPSAAVRLSPFQVVEDDRSYQAVNTLGVTRTNVALRDLPMQVNVVTEQLMSDRALFDFNQVLDAIPGTARSFDEFWPVANIRGFVSLHAMRNGVRSVTVPDLTAIARVETVKGPAALNYGWSQPGGVINYITKNPSPTRRATLRVSAGGDRLLRSAVDVTGPITAGGTFNYRLGLTRHSQEKGERERSLERVVVAPMLQWRPRPDTSVTVRYGLTQEDIRPSEGLVLKPTGAVNRGGDPSYFYPFNGLDAPRHPQWVTSVGPDFIRDSPSSYRDIRTAIWELEGTRRLNHWMDLRGNFALHRRARSSIRESPSTALINPWTQRSLIARLDGYNGWNLDNTRGEPFPEARFTYGFVGRDDNVPVGDPLADTRRLDGAPYVQTPGVRTLQYVDGVTGWRRVTWNGGLRRERRGNGQIDLVTRFRTGPIHHTLLTGFERNEDRRWENLSMLLRNPSLASTALYLVPGTTTQVPNLVDYYYNIFDPASTAARDAFARRNLPPLSGFTSNGTSSDFRTTGNAWYVNWSAMLLGERGRLVLGVRRDDISARGSMKNPGTNPLGFGGAVTSSGEGRVSRTTPQTGLSFRVSNEVTFYALYSQSLRPFVGLEPARTSSSEQQLLARFAQDGQPAPDLDALPWGELRPPQFGTSLEYGVKTDLLASKVTVNVACFSIDKKNISRAKPMSDPLGAVSVVDFTGAERARGVDVDFYARPIRGLQLGGGGLYNQTEIVAANMRTTAAPFATTFEADSGPAVTIPRVGQRLADAPKWSGHGYARYEFGEGGLKGFGLGVSYNYMGARPEGDTARWSEAWSRWDANASYRRKVLHRPTTFKLVVRNVTDRTFRVDADIFARRRQWVGAVDVEF